MCLFLESSGTVCQWDVDLQTLNEMCVKVTRLFLMMMMTRWFSCTVPSVLLSKLTKHTPLARAAKSQSVSSMELDQMTS